jgi:hypothetical protein
LDTLLKQHFIGKISMRSTYNIIYNIEIFDVDDLPDEDKEYYGQYCTVQLDENWKKYEYLWFPN